jgi:hypothetical protein
MERIAAGATPGRNIRGITIAYADYHQRSTVRTAIRASRSGSKRCECLMHSMAPISESALAMDHLLRSRALEVCYHCRHESRLPGPWPDRNLLIRCSVLRLQTQQYDVNAPRDCRVVVRRPLGSFTSTVQALMARSDIRLGKAPPLIDPQLVSRITR